MIKKIFKTIFKIIFWVALILIVAATILSLEKKPEKIKYGMSFNVPYTREINLDWKETYLAILDDLGVRQLRLAGHWPIIEPEKGKYNFEEMDFQIIEAQKRGAEVVLAIGRRLPRWPECHIPEWARGLSEEQWQAEITEYLEVMVNRYKKYDAIKYWQIENEPFLNAFANEHCGDLNVEFLDREIELVRKLDPERKILVTDSGNLGKWFGPYKRGDAFGTSVYLYFWNPELGRFKTLLPSAFYRAKANLMQLMLGEKETFLIELSLEPWLIQSVSQVPIETQLERMDLEKVRDILKYAENTRFEKQFLWGAEWWYWMKKNNHPEFWEFGKEIFKN